jgi:hypothetical protein
MRNVEGPMTTTVTTATVSTVTVMGITGALGLILTVVLIGLLVSREIAAAGSSKNTIRWARSVNIGIVPLLVSFAVIAGVRVAEIL